MPRESSEMRAGALAIVCADGLDGQGGIERFTGYLTEQFAADAPDLQWFIQRTRFRRGFSGHFTTPLALAQFARRCATGEVAMVHINVAPRGSTFRKMAFSAVARVFSVPVLVHLHGSGYDRFFEKCPSPGQALIRRFFNRAERVAVLGEHWRRFASADLGVPAEKLFTVENGVPEPASVALPNNGEAHLVFAGQLGSRKGVDVLLDSLAMLDADTPNWRATLAGGGDAGPFQRQAEAAGIAHKVTLPGWLGEEDVGRLMSSADIFVLPSRAENQPIAILEAMARGLPVVSTTVGAIPEQVEDGVSGLLAPPGEYRPLAIALARLISRPSERVTMGEAGRLRYLRRYSIQRCADAFRSVYAEMLFQSPPARTRFTGLGVGL